MLTCKISYSLNILIIMFKLKVMSATLNIDWVSQFDTFIKVMHIQIIPQFLGNHGSDLWKNVRAAYLTEEGDSCSYKHNILNTCPLRIVSIFVDCFILKIGDSRDQLTHFNSECYCKTQVSDNKNICDRYSACISYNICLVKFGWLVNSFTQLNTWIVWSYYSGLAL